MKIIFKSLPTLTQELIKNIYDWIFKYLFNNVYSNIVYCHLNLDFNIIIG